MNDILRANESAQSWPLVKAQQTEYNVTSQTRGYADSNI